MRLLLIAVGLVWSVSVASAAVTLEAPQSVAAGAAFDVAWSGSGEPRDFVTIVEAGAEAGTYSHYLYAEENKLRFTAPDDPGAYEIRYLSKDHPYKTLASVGLKVTPVTATVQVVSTVDAGAPFSIEWVGPGHEKDFITIVEAGAEERSYGPYVYTGKGSPLTLTAPDEPGSYEVRYLTGQKYFTLASAPITVEVTGASLQGPDQAVAGSTIKVEWTGPNNVQDWVGIAPAGSSTREYLVYQRTREGSPVQLRVPDESGSYEIRYLTGQTYTQLASIPLEVTATTASLSAPSEVRGGEPFKVDWSGPDHPRDYIGMVLARDGEKARHAAYEYTHKGTPATLTAPLDPGDYELRYETGQSAKILARTPIRVTPPTTLPGTLLVLAGEMGSEKVTLPPGGAVEVILDASGSMLKQQEGTRRIDIAKQVLTRLVEQTIPSGTPFALRVFGHKEKDSCRTDLEIPLQPLDTARASSTIGEIEAMNLAKTPIARSLELVAEDLNTATGERIVVLITDGEETCDGDPAAAIESLERIGMDVRVNIVGFAIDDVSLKDTFRYWASLGGGAYQDAGNAKDLDASMIRALRTPFDVFNESGERVASGLIGDEPIVMASGTYKVRTRVQPVSEATVVVKGGEETEITLGSH